MIGSARTKWIEASIFLGALPLITVAAVFIAATVQLDLGHSLDARSAIPGGIILAALAIVLMTRRSFTELKVTSGVILCALSIIFGLASFWISGRIFDVSYDGQTYHQEAIRQLASGWNYFQPPQFPAPRQEMEYTAPFLTHYCKLPWILSALVYQAGHNFEAAKCLHWVMMWAAFWNCCALLLALEFSVLTAVLLAGLAALNPVSVSQGLTFYVDGLFASTLTSFLAVTGLWVMRHTRFLLTALCCALLIGLQIKFTSTITTAVFVFGFFSLLWYSRDTSLIRPVFGLYAFAVICWLAAGYQPFVTNFRATGNPFFPIPHYSVAGETVESPAIQEVQLPINFKDANRLTKLAGSLFSKSANPFGTEASELKLPFQASLDEFRAFRNPDVRIAGFGPLFCCALLVAIISLALTRYRLAEFPPHPARGAYPVLALPLWLAFSVVLNPECWWARYTPQLWLIPIVILVQNRIVRGRLPLLDWVVVALLTVNAAGIAGVSVHSGYWRSTALKQELFLLKQEGTPFKVNFNRFRINELRLQAAGIPYTDEAATSCANPRMLMESPTTVCPGA